MAVLKRAVALLILVAVPARADDKSTATTERGTTTAPISAKPEDEEGVPRLSLPTESDRLAWTRPGFRLGLGLVDGDMIGIRGAPSGRLFGAELHAGLRLDEQWSLYSTFEYASASKANGLSGLRFEGTIDPTWHVTRSFSLAVGFGFGGIVEGHTNRPDVNPLGSTLDTSYTFPDARNPLPSCSGVGIVGLVRGAWAYVLGPRSTFNIEAELFGQETECTDKTGTLDPDNAQEIVRTQYWPHVGFTIGVGIAWR